MSLILDALNKADRERQANDAPPGIHTTHDVHDFKSEKPVWIYITLAAISISVLILIAWLVLSSKSEDSSKALGEPSTTKMAPPKLVKPEALAPQTAQAKQTPETISQTINKTETKVVESSVTEPENEPAPSRLQAAEKMLISQAKEERATISPAVVNELYGEQDKQREQANIGLANNDQQEKQYVESKIQAEQQPGKEEPARQIEKHETITNVYEDSSTTAIPTQPIQAQSASPQVKSKSAMDSLSDFPEVGNVTGLPLTVVNSLPSLNYSSHIYQGDTKQIVLNNQARKEGQKVQNIRVHKILKDGVILEYQGFQFKLKALNSWINI